MKSRSGEKIKIKTVEDMLCVGGGEISAEIEIAAIEKFKGHPFRVVDDAKMEELVESIRVNGVVSPVLVRPKGVGQYEMVSGHRRMHAAQMAGLTMIPAIVRDMSDEEATIVMVDANIQREELLPSEKAFAYKMRRDAKKRQGQRTDLTSCQSGTKLEAGEESVSNARRTDEELAEQVGESARTIQRYIRLTELTSAFREMVDSKKLPFTMAIELSYIPREIQDWIYEFIVNNGLLRMEQVLALRKHLEKEALTQMELNRFLNASFEKENTSSRTLKFSDKKLKKYFPNSYSKREIEAVIEELLEQWKKAQDGGMSEE